MKKLFLFLSFLPLLLFAQTALPTIWNFSTPGISDPPNGWITGLGINGNLTYSGAAFAIGGDNTSCRLDATGEFLTIWFADKPGEVSYWLRGSGGINGTPAFTGVFDVQESANGNSWTTMRSFTTALPASGVMVRYVNTPSVNSRYIRFFYTTKENGSNIALDSVIIKSAPPSPNATINLKQGLKNVVDNTLFTIGNSATTSFTIENKGTAEALTITGITFTGTGAQDYSVTNIPTSIAANTSATFIVNFFPADIGTSLAEMIIASNDAEKTKYEVSLYGIGGNLASEPLAQPRFFSFTNVKPYSFNCSYSHPASKPENYIVLRKIGFITEFPADGDTYARGDYIGGAQVAYIGKDTAFKPVYILANQPYQFKVFAFNGPRGFENYFTNNPLSATLTTPGSTIGNYYAGVASEKPSFVTDLTNKIKTHDTVFYSNYIGAVVNNFLTRDTTLGRKVVTCTYTHFQHLYKEPFLWWTGTNSGTLTREHTFAQSWMPTRNISTWPNGANGREFQEYNDIHQLFPANQVTANAIRSNYPFGEVAIPTNTSPTGKGKLGKDTNGKIVYEPAEEHKGDVARALFYMCIAYNGINGNNWSLGAIGAAQQNDSILKKWHFQDLPDALEIARHEYIASLQKNRNPFIDSVNFVCRINFNNLTWISNPNNCGVSIPSLTLTSPIGGEVWTLNPPNYSAGINWSSSLIDSVSIELYVADTLFFNLGTVAASVGTSTLSFLNLPISTPKAKIKLIGKNIPISTISTNYFTISRFSSLNDADRLFVAFNIYPNPSSKNVTIELKDLTIKSTDITVTDIAGRVILEKEMQSIITLTLEKQGMYFIKLQTQTGTIVKKVIVK